MYKTVELSVVEKKYVDAVARAVMNLMLAGERISQTGGLELGGKGHGHEGGKQKLIEFECEIQRLDDLLVVFDL